MPLLNIRFIATKPKNFSLIRWAISWVASPHGNYSLEHRRLRTVYLLIQSVVDCNKILGKLIFRNLPDQADSVTIRQKMLTTPLQLAGDQSVLNFFNHHWNDLQGRHSGFGIDGHGTHQNVKIGFTEVNGCE
jgi:hypothetical protein